MLLFATTGKENLDLEKLFKFSFIKISYILYLDILYTFSGDKIALGESWPSLACQSESDDISCQILGNAPNYNLVKYYFSELTSVYTWNFGFNSSQLHLSLSWVRFETLHYELTLEFNSKRSYMIFSIS